MNRGESFNILLTAELKRVSEEIGRCRVRANKNVSSHRKQWSSVTVWPQEKAYVASEKMKTIGDH